MKEDKTIEGIVEKILKDSPLKVYFENNPYKTVDIYEDTQNRICQSLYRVKEQEKERISDLLIQSMPDDAENLSTLTGWQARETIQNFLKHLGED